MRIAVSAGHNIYANGYFDNGTSGHGRREAAEAKATVAIVIRLLRAKGHEVLDVTPYNQRFVSNNRGTAHKNAHQERANRINRFKPDLYLDFHLNAGGGTGPETIVHSTRSPAYPWARKITNSIAAKTGLTNRRGVKVLPNMWSVSLQSAPSIIIEGAFMDTKRDMDCITPQLYAEAVADVFPNLKPKEAKKVSEARVREIIKEEIAKTDNKEDVGSWAHNAIEHVKREGIMVGFEDGSFKPNKAVTRAELAQVIYNMRK